MSIAIATKNSYFRMGRGEKGFWATLETKNSVYDFSESKLKKYTVEDYFAYTIEDAEEDLPF